MNLRLTRIAVACGFAVALVAATASCSFPPRAQEAQAQAPTAPVRPAPLRIVQLSFGQNAYFAACAFEGALAVGEGFGERSSWRTPARSGMAIAGDVVDAEFSETK